MRKIPTLYERDWGGNRALVTRQINPEAAWLLSEPATAYWKLDGTCCRFKDGLLYKRHEVKPGKTPPAGFVLADHDETTGKQQGWLPVGTGPEDRYANEAWNLATSQLPSGSYFPDATCELIGPKVQGNRERQVLHRLVFHDDPALIFDDVPLEFDALRGWLEPRDIEGIVWHGQDGRMAKIKKSDFGLKRIEGK